MPRGEISSYIDIRSIDFWIRRHEDVQVCKCTWILWIRIMCACACMFVIARLSNSMIAWLWCILCVCEIITQVHTQTFSQVHQPRAHSFVLRVPSVVVLLLSGARVSMTPHVNCELSILWNPFSLELRDVVLWHLHHEVYIYYLKKKKTLHDIPFKYS